MKTAVSLMLKETAALSRLGALVLIPIGLRIVRASIRIALAHHLYVADVLQKREYRELAKLGARLVEELRRRGADC